MQFLQVYVVEFSKYFVNICMVLYAYECFAVFRLREEERRRGIYVRQNLLLFLIHFSCFLCIFFESQKLEYLFFYALQLIALYAVIVLFQMLYPKINRLIVNNMCLLLSIGFVIITRISYEKAIRQFIIAAGSLAVALLIPFFIRQMNFLKHLTWIYASVGMVALTVVFVLGQVTNGSKLSFSLAGIAFQPSEFVKILFVFFVAGALCQAAGFFQVFTTVVVAAFHVVILVASKDLGSALIFFVVYVLMVYLATGNVWYVLAGAAGGGGAAVLAGQIFRHVQVRVQAWQDPWSVIDSTGYQITQSLFAISNGGWLGLGLHKGNPSVIPFVEADLVFSAVAEELGVLFGVGMILVCISCFVMFMNISLRLEDRFYQLLAFGLGVTYIFQVFLTVGGGTKFIPLTGVTLPLVSYGGSSVLTTLIIFSIIAGLYMIKMEEEEKQETQVRRHQRGRRMVPGERESSRRRMTDEW